MLEKEYKKCLLELEVAQNHFNHADEDFVDVAIYYYNAVLAKHKALYKLIQKNKKKFLTKDKNYVIINNVRKKAQS